MSANTNMVEDVETTLDGAWSDNLVSDEEFYEIYNSGGGTKDTGSQC